MWSVANPPPWRRVLPHREVLTMSPDYTNPVNTDAIRQNSTDLSDVRCALPEVGGFRGYGPDVTDAINTLSRREWDHLSTSPVRVDVFTAFARLIPLLGLHPGAGIDDKTLEWRWSTVRCLLSGVGHAGWADVANALLDVDPSAPLSPAEDANEWYTALQAAHSACGIPVTLAFLPFDRLTRVVGELTDALTPSWLTAAAAFHILKHLRTTDTHLRVVYRGNVAEIPHQEAEGNFTQTIAKLTGVLGFTKPSKKDASIADIVAWPVMNKLRPSNLLRTRALTAVPPTHFSGGWSRLAPGYYGDSDFTETQTRLLGVKVAKDGKVLDCRGDEKLVLDYAWHAHPLDSKVLQAEDQYLRTCPTTYPKDFRPFDILAAYATNIATDWAGEHAEAMKAIYDAFLTLPVLRYYRRSEFARTHPFGWVMPIHATVSGSTDNGASSIAAAIARTHMPTYPTASQTNDHESSPDNRALADRIQTYGGLWLDDWKMPKSSGHVLSKDKLQTLATGGGIEVGKVLENRVTATTLEECFVINTKCVDLPPDLINRSVFFYADKVTDEQKGDFETGNALTEGRVAIEIRFAALHWIKWLELDTCLPVSTPIRFPLFAAVAAQFAKHRGLADPVGAVAAAWKFAGEYQQVHYREAEDSGLVHQVENRRSVTARVADLFDGCSIELLCTCLSYDGIGRGSFAVTDIAHARCVLTMGERCPVALNGCLVAIGIPVPPGSKPRMLTLAYNDDVKRLMPAVGDEFVVHPGNGTGQWKIRRMADNNNTPRVKLVPPDVLK